MHKSAISREIKRNRGGRGYRPKNRSAIIAGKNKNCESVMNGSTNISIEIKGAVDHSRDISDAVKSAENATAAMANAVKYPTGHRLMSVHR